MNGRAWFGTDVRKRMAQVLTLGLVVTMAGGCPLAGPGDGAATLALRMRELVDDELVLHAPEDATVECDGEGNVSALGRWLGSVSVESTCDGAMVTNDFTGVAPACGSTGAATVTWTASDDCGNTLSHTAALTIADGIAPVLDGPPDVTVDCEGDATASALRRWLNAVSATDDCSDVTLTSETLRLSDGCGDIGTTEATWVATDDCGNVSTHTATFTITGTVPRLMITTPGDVAIECDLEDHESALNRWLAIAEVSGGCGGAALVHETIRTDGDCPQEYAWETTWTATDDCGAGVSASATLSVEDSTPPTIAGPRPLELICGDPDLRSSINRWLASASAEDNCGAATIDNDFERLHDACGLTGEATVIWTATDACGNSSRYRSEVRTVDTLAPILTVPADRHDLCAGLRRPDDLASWVDSATAEDECGEVAITHAFDRDAVTDACELTVTFTGTDECGNAVSDTAVATLVDNEPPVLSLNGDVDLTLECNVDEYVEEGAAVVDACDTLLTEATVGGDSVDISMTGDYVVRYDAADVCGNEGEPVTRTVTVVDTLPPFAVEGFAVQLWSPNHVYVTLSLADCVRDLCEEELDVDALGRIISIYSDEPENTTGDGNTIDDIVILSNSTFMVRAERRGGGDGRVYGVTFEMSDSAGNTAIDTCLIGVPHDQSGDLPVDSGADAGYTVEAP